MPPKTTTKAIHPNKGVELRYKRKLQRLIKSMAESFNTVIDLLQHRAESAAIKSHMVEVGTKWVQKFEVMSDSIADSFVRAQGEHVERAMMATFQEAGWTVNFKFTEGASQAYSAVIAENVGLIKSIPQEYLKRVEAEVWNTVAFGYDLEELTHSLVKIGNISYKRAGFIALDQSNKAKAIIEKQRREELGITEAIWQHSGGGKKPRHSHVKAGQDRLIFNVSKGAYIDGDWILPGELINCRCTSRAIIPGLKKSK